MNLTIDQALLEAVQAQQSGRLQDAERLYRAILERQPNHAEANHNLGVLAVGAGKPEQALPFLESALKANRNQGHFWISYINALLEARQAAEAGLMLTQGRRLGLKGDAVDRLEQKLAQLPHPQQPPQQDIESLFSEYKAGNLALAEQLARALTRQFPDHFFGWKVLGVIINQTGRIEESLQPMQQAVRLAPGDPEVHNNLGNTFQDLGQFTQAEASCREAIRLDPDFAQAHYNLSRALHVLARYAEAEASAREATRLKPDHVDAHINLGNALHELGRASEAERSYREAVRLKPGYAQAHSNLGNALRALGRLNEAESSHREAIRLDPGIAGAHINLGVLLQDQGRIAEAQASHSEAIRLKPGFKEALWNLSLCLLIQGDFRNGLPLHEMRWGGSKELKIHEHRFAAPPWLGEASLNGKTILIHAEQGLGDTIQFCRYVRMVHDLGARVIFEVQPALMALLADLDGVDQLIAQTRILPAFDYHCPLLSLPLAFKTDPARVPASIPYLHAQPERVSRWNERLGFNGFKIGICWKGAKKERSIPIEHFLGLSRIPQVRLISLQKGDGNLELGDLPSGMIVETLGADFDSTGAFMDTAAVMKCCDLVISNDTSIGHLAGALGIATWTALLFMPDWRWMLERLDSPWSPNIRLFRQSAAGDWAGVFERMEAALRSQLGEMK